MTSSLLGWGPRLTLVVTALACSFSHPVGPAILEAELCRPLAILECEARLQCRCPVFDFDDCVARSTELCVATRERTDAGSFSADNARACVALLSASSTPCVGPDPSVWDRCAPWYVHDADVGDPCDDGFCAGGHGRCEGGSCVERFGPDAVCTRLDQCDSELECSSAGRCTRMPREGEACADGRCLAGLRCEAGVCKGNAVRAGAMGEPCVDALQCGEGLSCFAGTCAPVPATCETDGSCGSGLVCRGPRRCRLRANVGEPCDPRYVAVCADDLYCAEAGVCAEAAGLMESCAGGATCGAGLMCIGPLDSRRCVAALDEGDMCGGFGRQCREDLECTVDTSQCAPPRGEGGACGWDSNCAAGLYCQGSSVCAVPAAEGESCEASRCGEGLRCVDEVCVSQLPPGATCTSSPDCLGACVPTTGGQQACADRGALGARCWNVTDCVPEARCVEESLTCISARCPIP